MPRPPAAPIRLCAARPDETLNAFQVAMDSILALLPPTLLTDSRQQTVHSEPSGDRFWAVNSQAPPAESGRQPTPESSGRSPFGQKRKSTKDCYLDIQLPLTPRVRVSGGPRAREGGRHRVF